MTNRRRTVSSIVAVALMALLVPVAAAAQQDGPWWGRGRDRDRDIYRDRNRDRDYGRDRDYRRDRDYERDRYGYNRRAVRDAVHRVEDRSEDFEDHLDSALDRSRYDDSRREDRINDVARQFRDASRRLKSRFGNGQDLSRSEGEARQLLQIAARIDQFMARNRLDSRVTSDWSQIRYDLRVIANAYGLHTGDYNSRRGGYDPRYPDYRGGRWPF